MSQINNVIQTECRVTFASALEFVFNTFLLVQNTDLSTFTTGRAHYGQLIPVKNLKR